MNSRFYISIFIVSAIIISLFGKTLLASPLDEETPLTLKPQQNVYVSIPQITGLPSEIIDVPVLVDDLTGKGVLSVALEIEVDENILTPVNATTENSLTESWGNPTYNIFEGKIIVAISGIQPLSDSGTLMYIKYQVKPDVINGDTTTIHFTKAFFNEGIPGATTNNGFFTAVNKYQISGMVYYYNMTAPLKNVIMKLDGETNLTDTTSSIGDYQFLDIPYGKYTLKPRKSIKSKGAISPFDASLVSQHYVDLIILSVFQKIAADVSGNGQVTPYDASLILQYYVGLIEKFPAMKNNLDAWKIVPDNFPLNDNNFPTAPDSLLYDPLNDNKQNQNFSAILLGDLSGNWDEFDSISKTATKFITISLGNIIWHQPNKLTIPVYVDKAEIISAGIELEYHPDVINIHSVLSSEITSDYAIAHNIAEKTVKIGLAGTKASIKEGVILYLECGVKNAKINETDFLTIQSATINEGEFKVHIENRELTLQPSIPDEVSLSQNYPNPFNPKTTIEYQIPNRTHVELRIFNLFGQEVKTLIDESKKAGRYEIKWDGTDNNGLKVTSGIYIYKIQAKSFTKSKKLAILK